MLYGIRYCHAGHGQYGSPTSNARWYRTPELATNALGRCGFQPRGSAIKDSAAIQEVTFSAIKRHVYDTEKEASLAEATRIDNLPQGSRNSSSIASRSSRSSLSASGDQHERQTVKNLRPLLANGTARGKFRTVLLDFRSSNPDSQSACQHPRLHHPCSMLSTHFLMLHHLSPTMPPPRNSPAPPPI